MGFRSLMQSRTWQWSVSGKKKWWGEIKGSFKILDFPITSISLKFQWLWWQMCKKMLSVSSSFSLLITPTLPKLKLRHKTAQNKVAKNVAWNLLSFHSFSAGPLSPFSTFWHAFLYFILPCFVSTTVDYSQGNPPFIMSRGKGCYGTIVTHYSAIAFIGKNHGDNATSP